MKNRSMLIALVLGGILPCLMLCVLSRQQLILDTEPTERKDGTKSLYVLLADGMTQEMALEDYILGVVLAEMPASFEIEALKAQAVVARTYTLRGKRHGSIDICTDPACCQAYCAPENYKGSVTALQKVESAVQQTAGMIVTYEGKPIEATYFSCSGGRTEDAVAVWGQSVPYLQAVDSPGEEKASVYLNTTFMTASEFSQAFGGLSGSPNNWIGKITYTNGGGVETIQIGGKSYKGTQVRKLLGLRSTAFAITIVGSSVTITTKGNGHRVGMSQYGADAMALSGKDYEAILAHYYPGTALQGIDNIQ